MSKLGVILTGTGAPRPNSERANSGQVVMVDNRPILVDCGGGTVRQMLTAGVDVSKIDTLFLTHLHSDHTLDYAEFVLGSWAMGRSKLQVIGPPGTKRLHQLLVMEPYREDINYRMSLGRSGDGVLDIDIQEIGPGVIYDEGGLRVTAAEVVHSIYTLAMRFDYGDKTLVISSDTCYCPEIVELSRDADILVHDCCMAPAKVFENNPAWPNLYDHLKQHHATPVEAGRVAQEAGVSRLILTHLLIGLYEERTLAEAQSAFDGDVRLGEDLMQVWC